MLQDEQYVAETLGIEDWPADKKEEAVVEGMLRAGGAITEGLSEEQDQEYTAIINDDHEVINQWLEQNVPDYKENPLYQMMANGTNDDPEHNNPAKLFATAAWFKINVPDAEERVEKALATYKQELAAS